MRFIPITVAALIVALAAGAAGYMSRPTIEKTGWLGPRSGGLAADDKDSAQPVPRPAVTALGRLEPETEIIGVGLTAGSRVERLGEKVAEGAFVTKGEPLAYLDSYSELLAARNLAQVQLDEAK